jgi:hypothetical protein
MTGESGHFTGSDWLSRRTNRHGFPKNRHGYFANTSVCPRIGGTGPAACPKKAAFSEVIAADNLRDGVKYDELKETVFSDRTRIRKYPNGHQERRENKPKSGSDWHSRRTNRHGFFKNRHGYFTNPSVRARIGGMEPVTSPKKALFSAVTAGDRKVDRAADQGIQKNPAFPGVSV